MSLESIISIDQQALLAINGWHSPFFDQFFWLISSRWLWIPLYILLIYCIVRQSLTHPNKQSKLHPIWRNLIIIAAVFACVGLADFIASGIFKPLVCRPRPSHEPALQGMVHLVNNRAGSLYGFMSSHAANTAAIATICSLLLKNKWWTITLIFYAVLNCYSRMYLGLHYPLDILCGALVGITLAFLTYYILRLCKLLNTQHYERRH